MRIPYNACSTARNDGFDYSSRRFQAFPVQQVCSTAFLFASLVSYILRGFWVKRNAPGGITATNRAPATKLKVSTIILLSQSSLLIHESRSKCCLIRFLPQSLAADPYALIVTGGQLHLVSRGYRLRRPISTVADAHFQSTHQAWSSSWYIEVKDKAILIIVGFHGDSYSWRYVHRVIYVFVIPTTVELRLDLLMNKTSIPCFKGRLRPKTTQLKHL